MDKVERTIDDVNEGIMRINNLISGDDGNTYRNTLSKTLLNDYGWVDSGKHLESGDRRILRKEIGYDCVLTLNMKKPKLEIEDPQRILTDENRSTQEYEDVVESALERLDDVERVIDDIDAAALG